LLPPGLCCGLLPRLFGPLLRLAARLRLRSLALGLFQPLGLFLRLCLRLRRTLLRLLPCLLASALFRSLALGLGFALPQFVLAPACFGPCFVLAPPRLSDALCLGKREC